MEWSERDWFSGGKAILALSAGLAGSWMASLLGGSRQEVWDAILLLFPMAVVAALAASRLRDGDRRNHWLLRSLLLIVAPILLGGAITIW